MPSWLKWWVMLFYQRCIKQWWQWHFVRLTVISVVPQSVAMQHAMRCTASIHTSILFRIYSMLNNVACVAANQTGTTTLITAKTTATTTKTSTPTTRTTTTTLPPVGEPQFNVVMQLALLVVRDVHDAPIQSTRIHSMQQNYYRLSCQYLALHCRVIQYALLIEIRRRIK